MPNPKQDEDRSEEAKAPEPEEAKATEAEPEAAGDQPQAPDLASALSEFMATMTARLGTLEAEIGAQREAMAALANQGAVSESVADEDEGEEYPEIDLEGIGRMIGDY